MNVKAGAKVAMKANFISPSSTTNVKTRSIWRPRKQLGPAPASPAILRQKPRYNMTHKTKKRASAADVLQLMDSLQLPVDADMYDSLIKECTFDMDAVQGAEIHAHITRPKENKSSCSRGRLVNLANRMLLMYSACGHADVARQLFDGMPRRNASSWAAVISAVAHAGGHREAIELFVEMLRADSVEPGNTLVLLFTVVLGSCVQIGELELGNQLHGLAVRMAVVDKLAAPLIKFYAAFNHIESAGKFFDTTSLVSAYCGEGRLHEAARAFGDLFNVGGSPSGKKKRKSISIAFASILSACAKTDMGSEGYQCGRQVHASAIKIGIDSDLFVGTSLVNMYGRRFGLLGEARRAFDAVSRSHTKDGACWNAMIRSYLRGGCYDEAIKLLYEMKSAGIEPLESVVCQVRIACGG